MTRAFLCGIALACSTAAIAQTPAGPAPTTPKTTTLTGCVEGGVNSPITLANAMVIPAPADADAAAASPGAVPEAPPSPAQPPTTAGSSGTAGTTGAVAPTAAITGTAPAGSSASSISGYRLSGTDMAAWIGRRVQIVGVLVPPAAGASAAPKAGEATTPSTLTARPELRVMSVQAITGECPPR